MDSTVIPSARIRLRVRLFLGCAALAALAACSSGRQQQSYSGEDTAYYLSHAQGNYNPPGPPDDPWGPYIRIASNKFDVPQMWIRQVMRVESGGHEYSNGQLIVSGAGAMGLMQLEPGTYQEMAERYGLANDPFNPLDNILAGTAYIHEMYQIYGCPGFLAAYNAGPGRLDSYIHYDRPLPLQTTNYVDMIAPNIDGYYPHHRSTADELALNTQPMGIDGGILPRGFVAQPPTPAELSSPIEVASLSPAYSNNAAPVSVPVSSIMPQVAQIEAGQTHPAQAQVESASLPPPVHMASTQPPAPTPVPAHIMMARAVAPPIPRPPYTHSSGFTLIPPAMASTSMDTAFNSGQRSWGIQVGAYDTSSNAKAALGMAEITSSNTLNRAEPVVMRVSVKGDVMYRARFVGMQHNEAINACSHLSGGPTGCVVLSPDQQS